ncbi:MAG TPA: flagellar biosynthetic protein FliO [Alphaproteobacteria bacterium]|nr:flagellar biosynthetic protein FliO [Alphaproteobacteria bacterium]
MDYANYVQFILALIFVLALIGLLAWAYRRFVLGQRSGLGPRGASRLQIIEFRNIDAKRRLVLLKRDDVEHLVLLGPNSETVIESGIRGRGGRPTAPAAGERP